MTVVRAVQLEDLDQLWELLGQAAYGLTTLQISKEQLSERVEHSHFAFTRKTQKPSGEPYVFVMQDTDSGRLVGLSCIFSKTGGYEPFYSYARVTESNYCELLNKVQEVEALHLQKLHDGPTEIGSLFLLPEYRSYFFNSQIISPRSAGTSSASPRMVLISPQQCREIASTHRLIDRLIASPDNPLEAVHYVPLEQSMANGGGPACLRLRVPLREAEIGRLPARLRLDLQLHERLTAAIERWYPERLELADLCDLDYARELAQVSMNLRK